MKRFRKKAIIAAAALIALALMGVAALVFPSCQSGEDILAGRRSPMGAKGPGGAGPRIPGEGGGPLFRFGSPYLDGRSAWLAGRFREEREGLRAAPIPAEPAIECLVHREPFTEGPWVASLSPDQARQRDEVERESVESHLTFFVPRVAPRAVVRYLVGSEYMTRIPDEGKIERELFFPPLKSRPPGLHSIPALGTNEFLSRDRWSRQMTLPTDVFNVHAVFLDGDVACHIVEA